MDKLKLARKFFHASSRNENNVLYGRDNLTKKFCKKLWRSGYEKDKIFAKLLWKAESKEKIIEIKETEDKTHQIFTYKVYIYLIKKRKIIARKINFFYEVVKQKRKGRKMCLQIDQEFLQGEIKSLSYNPNIEMFSTHLRSRKPFAVEEKIKRIKKRDFTKLNL